MEELNSFKGQEEKDLLLAMQNKGIELTGDNDMLTATLFGLASEILMLRKIIEGHIVGAENVNNGVGLNFK